MEVNLNGNAKFFPEHGKRVVLFKTGYWHSTWTICQKISKSCLITCPSTESSVTSTYYFYGCDIVERWICVVLHWPMWIYQLGCQHCVPMTSTYMSAGHLDLTQCDKKLCPWNSCNSRWQIPNRNLDVWSCSTHASSVTQRDTLDFLLSSLHINLCHIKQSAGSRGHCGNTWAKLWALKHDFPLQTLWTVLTWLVIVILLNCYLC